MMFGHSSAVPWNLKLPQRRNASSLKSIGAAQYVQQNKILAPAKLRTVSGQAIRAIIWIQQTRPNIGFGVGEIATGDVESCQDVAKANRNYGAVQQSGTACAKLRQKIEYLGRDSSPDTLQRRLAYLGKFRLIAFTEAGFFHIERQSFYWRFCRSPGRCIAPRRIHLLTRISGGSPLCEIQQMAPRRGMSCYCHIR